MEKWLDWARGPAFIFALTFMLLGLARHWALTIWEIYRARRRAGDKSLPYREIIQNTLRWLFPIGAIARNPLLSITSIVFHLAVLITPLFLAGHIALWHRSIGLSWPAIPNSLADVLTVLAVGAAAALFVQRLSAKATRTLSRFQDYALPWIIALPFFTGFLVMHPAYNPFSYSAALFVHVMSANLTMAIVPLTKLAHAALLPGAQLAAELGWRWPPDAGSKLGASLGKEEASL